MKSTAPYFVFLLTILAVLFTSCEDTDPVEDEMEEEKIDVTPPSISVIEFSDIVEVITDLQVSVTDDSDVIQSTVSINGEEVANSSTKDFSVTLNPFEYPIGTVILEIKSIDVSGNETIVSESIEFKRLLFRMPSDNIEYYQNTGYYVILNDSLGKLMEFKLLDNDGADVVFYADENFEVQNFRATLFTYPMEGSTHRIHRMNTYEDIAPGTTLPTSQQLMADEHYYEYVPRDKVLDIEIVADGIFNMNGTGYLLNGGEGNIRELNYSSAIDQNFMFLTSFQFEGVPRDDYSYVIIDDLEKTTYTTEDFVKPANFQDVGVPNEIKNSTERGWFGYSVNAYRSSADYENRRYHRLLDYGSTDNIFNDGLEIALIDQFQHYELSFYSSEIPNYDKRQKQVGLVLKPFPEMNLYSVDNSIVTTGTYDYIFFDYGFYDFDDEGFKGLQWFYYAQPNSEIAIPYQDFQLPEEVEQILANHGLSADPSADSSKSGIKATLLNTSSQRNYKDYMFENNNFYNYKGEWYSLQYTIDNGSSKSSRLKQEKMARQFLQTQ